MSKYQKCPVCNGKGVVDCMFYKTHPYGATTSMADENCRTCGGTGIIVEPT